MQKPKLIVVVGPTAAGKTDYAIQLAKQISGVVVSADSRQVYSGMNVGSAKPRPAWLAAAHGLNTADIVDDVPHYLLNIREPNQMMTLAEWQEAAWAAIEKIIESGETPLLVGGTMLYVDSIVKNFDIPRVKPDPAFRELKSQNAKGKLYEELLKKDPGAGKFIEPHNTQRIIRALEVIEATGQPFSVQRQKQESPYDVKILGLFSDWEELAKRIEERAQKMLEDGLLEETAALREHYGADLPLLKTMNYRQAARVLDGILSPPQAVAEMKKENMRYARRQMSWWKNRKEIEWLRSTPC